MKLTQIEPIIESLPRGPILRKIIALALRILTGVVIFAGLFVVLGVIGQTINLLGNNLAEALGHLIALVLIVAAILLAVKVLLFRARNILIENETEYPLIRISALLLRTGGELIALFYSAAGLVAGIMVWFGGQFPFIPTIWQFFSIYGTPPFILGLGIIFSSLLQALFGLIVLYLLAELLILFRNLALRSN
jgi:hypothetical protein